MPNMPHSESALETAIDDPTAWEKPSRGKKKSEQRQRAAMVSVRLSPDELQAVQAAATKSGMSLSAFMRDRAVREGKQARKNMSGRNGNTNSLQGESMPVNLSMPYRPMSPLSA